MQACLRFIANGLLWVGLSGTVSAELVVTFQRLGDLYGGGYYSTATDVSHDGSVIVGVGGGPLGQEAFIWEDGMMTSLGLFSRANAVSGDGLTVVGEARDSDDQEWPYPVVWKDGIRTRLTGAEGSPVLGWAALVSGDGSVILGLDPVNQEWLHWHNGYLSVIGKTADAELEHFSFHGMSTDGTVLVGDRTVPPGQAIQGYWKDGNWTSLGIPLGHIRGMPYGANADGSVIVGMCISDDGHFRACRWVNGVPILLALPPGATDSWAFHVSDDGRVILGKVIYPNEPWSDIALWKAATQWNANLMQSVLTANPVGIDPALLSIEVPGEWGSLSGDGNTFVGYLVDTYEAFSLSIVNMWGQYPIFSRYADTTPWLGWLYVADAPWCWSVSLNRWLYIPDSSADAGMGWVYVTR